MSAILKTNSNSEQILGKALLNARQALGISFPDLSKIIGIDRSTLSRLQNNPAIKPNTKRGELSLMVIRCYRSLFALFGGDEQVMQQWLHKGNKHLHGKPVQLMTTAEGLVRVNQYLDAMRGK